MRALLQQVRGIRVEVGEQVIGAINYSLLMFICAIEDDSESVAAMLV